MASREKDTARQNRVVADMTTQLAGLRAMTVAQLRDRYRDVYGEPTRSRNKDYLRKKIAWRIQELAEGGLSKRALHRLAELADDAPARRRWRGTGRREEGAAIDSTRPESSRDPRLPDPGTVITRVHRGVEHKVTVLADGFEFAGTRFASLSRVAREITGTRWNGYLFFGLQRRAGEPGAETRA